MDELNEFIERVRQLLGPNPPSIGPGEVEAVLELARVAAHSSERRGAPAAPEAREAFLDDLVVKLEVQRS
jgi:hypothetical protein